jgi:hypothetical protein
MFIEQMQMNRSLNILPSQIPENQLTAQSRIFPKNRAKQLNPQEMSKVRTWTNSITSTPAKY